MAPAPSEATASDVPAVPATRATSSDRPSTPAEAAPADAVLAHASPTDEIAAPARASFTLDAPDPRRPASRADTVLAAAILPQFASVSFSQAAQWLGSEDMLRKFEEMQRQLHQGDVARETTLASSLAVTGSLSIGYVIWLVRGGVLMSSMLSALPAWQMIDPMPVLAAAGSAGRARPDSGGDHVERLFDRAGPEAHRPGAHRVQSTDAASAAAPTPAATEAMKMEILR